MEDSEETQEKVSQQNEDSQDSQEDVQDGVVSFSSYLMRMFRRIVANCYNYHFQGVSKWERMEAEDKLGKLS